MNKSKEYIDENWSTLVLDPDFWQEMSREYTWPDVYRYEYNGVKHTEPYEHYVAGTYFRRLLAGNRPKLVYFLEETKSWPSHQGKGCDSLEL